MPSTRNEGLLRFTWYMSRAMAIGYADGVSLLLRDPDNLQPSQALLGTFVHAVLDQPTYNQVASASATGNHMDAAFLPATEQEYERNLGSIVHLLAAHGADLALKNKDGLTAADRAFTELRGEDVYWHGPARCAIVTCTLEQNPAWQPDIPGAFKALPVQTSANRQLLARQIGELGFETRQWLEHYAEPGHPRDAAHMRHAPVYGDMSPAARRFWTATNWQIDASAMPTSTDTTMAANGNDAATLAAQAIARMKNSNGKPGPA